MLRTGFLTIIVGLTALCVVTGCAVAPTPPSTPTLPATSTREPTPTSLPTPTPFPPCDSSQFMVPTSMITTSQRVDARWGGESDRYEEQRGWLSIRLELQQSIVKHAEPISLQITFTNKRDVPIIFARPQHISFFGDATLEPNQSSRLEVTMRSWSGKFIMPVSTMVTLLHYYPPPSEAFSQLPPRSSCSMELPLIWDETMLPLSAPIPPGNYAMWAISQHFDPGPQVSKGASELWDIGAWVGETRSSNTVTFTVLPPEK